MKTALLSMIVALALGHVACSPKEATQMQITAARAAAYAELVRVMDEDTRTVFVPPGDLNLCRTTVPCRVPVKDVNTSGWNGIRVIDKETNLPAVRASVTIEKINRKDARVRGELFYSPLGMKSFIYTLEWKDGVWWIERMIPEYQ